MYLEFIVQLRLHLIM